MAKKFRMIIWMSKRKPHCYGEVCSISKSIFVYLDDHLCKWQHSYCPCVPSNTYSEVMILTGQPLLSPPSGHSHLTCDWAEALWLEC